MALGERQKDKDVAAKLKSLAQSCRKTMSVTAVKVHSRDETQQFLAKSGFGFLETFLIELFPISAASVVMTTAVVVTHGGIRAQGQSSCSLWRIFWPKLQSHELKEQRTALNQSSMVFKNVFNGV